MKSLLVGILIWFGFCLGLPNLSRNHCQLGNDMVSHWHFVGIIYCHYQLALWKWMSSNVNRPSSLCNDGRSFFFGQSPQPGEWCCCQWRFKVNTAKQQIGVWSNLKNAVWGGGSHLFPQMLTSSSPKASLPSLKNRLIILVIGFDIIFNSQEEYLA